VLAALRERDRTGLGQKVASSLFESATFMLGAVIVGSAVIGGPMPPMPARKNAWGVYDIFTAGDGGQVFIGCTSDGHWQRFCEAFGLDDWREDERLADNARRCEARAWMLPELERRLGALTLADILARCEAARVAYARVGRPDELAADPHLIAHGGLLATAISGLGGGPQVGVPALPLEFGDERERPGLERQPPRIGEHTAEVLREAGLSADAVAELTAAGVVAMQAA
jgi:crotonobetainyl-CoA:carnitine CoA-transferase CaiB-like acyl-CoA transferase